MKPKSLIGAMLLGAALFLSPGLAASSDGDGSAPAPLRVADLRPIELQLDGPGLSRIGAGAAAVLEIKTEDASFIKVHFDYLSLPDGIALEVASPDGSERYHYSNQRRDGYTVDADLGHDGRSSFSAMSITGPAAVLRLIGAARADWLPHHGIRISRYHEGYPDDMLPTLQKDGLLEDGIKTRAICGNNDKRGVACYASSEPNAFDRSRPVARLVMSGSLCTAWRVGPSNRMFTNNHCMSTAARVAASEVWFNYQAPSCGGGSSATTTKVAGDQLLATNSSLDYTLFTVKNFASVASFGYLGLDIASVTSGDQIYIPQHPGGRLKELGVVSDRDGGGYCRVGANYNDNYGYYCDTEGGSSGSPVLARRSNRVVALHYAGSCYNRGKKIALIWPQVSSHFGGQVPDGDTGGGPDPDPDPDPDQLSNGVAVGNLSGATGSERRYIVAVPAGASNLQIRISGGSGDADLYVRFGQAPTTSAYDCRPYLNGNNETCTVASPQTGTYHVLLRGYSSYSGVTLVASWDTGGGAPCTNCTRYTGSLSGTGQAQVQPNGNYYQSGAGTHRGWLRGPTTADFDLELYRWNGSAWTRVAQSVRPDSNEEISYNGSAGYYYWRILSYSGSGSYEFWLQRP